MKHIPDRKSTDRPGRISLEVDYFRPGRQELVGTSGVDADLNPLVEIKELVRPVAAADQDLLALTCAEGETVLTGARELRVKESDRIQVMADGLQILGVNAQPTEDGMVIQGSQIGGGEVESHGDHRIAMSFAMAALRANAPITIRDCANVDTSFPGFASLAAGCGLNIQVQE